MDSEADEAAAEGLDGEEAAEDSVGHRGTALAAVRPEAAMMPHQDQVVVLEEAAMMMGVVVVCAAVALVGGAVGARGVDAHYVRNWRTLVSVNHTLGYVVFSMSWASLRDIIASLSRWSSMNKSISIRTPTNYPIWPGPLPKATPEVYLHLEL